MTSFQFSDSDEPNPDAPELRLSVSQPTLSSLLLEMRWEGRRLSTGTGFVVEHSRGPLLITNKHNLAGVDSRTGDLMSSRGVTPNTVVVLHQRTLAPVRYRAVEERLYDDNGQPLWLEHPVNHRYDVVALPLTQLADAALYPYSLAPPERPLHIEVGDGVAIIGFPYGQVDHPRFPLPTWSRGYIATEPMLHEDQIKRFTVDVRSRPGQSGSPVVIYRPPGFVSYARPGTGPLLEFCNRPTTQLLGIYSGRLPEVDTNDDPANNPLPTPDGLAALERRILNRVQSSDLGIVWKVNVIRDVLERGVVRMPGKSGVLRVDSEQP